MMNKQVMKTKIAVLAMSLVGVGMLGCNAAKPGAGASTGTSANMLASSWVITTTETGSGAQTVTTAAFVATGTPIYEVSLVGYTSCNLSSLLGTGPVQGPACFLAAGSGVTGLGSLSVNNPEIGALELLIGEPTNPAPPGSTVTLWYNEDLQFPGVWTITGTGTVNNNGTVSGTWTCNAQATLYAPGQPEPSRPPSSEEVLCNLLSAGPSRDPHLSGQPGYSQGKKGKVVVAGITGRGLD
jgi:hypothetical protein